MTETILILLEKLTTEFDSEKIINSNLSNICTQHKDLTLKLKK